MAERSILAAVSGIDANQTYLDSVANDIANADTVGFKSENVQFQDLLAEQISGGAAPTTGGAGINPVSIGSGVRVGANTVDLSEGSLEATGQATDVAIQGAGYLVTDTNGQIGYTRDGSLTIDGNGNLATQYGGLVQGWQANGAGTVNTNAPTSAIRIPAGETIPAQATTELTLGGNLPAWSGVGTQPTATTTLNAYDSLGNAVAVTLTFTGVAGSANNWTVSGSVLAPNGTTDNLWATNPNVAFNPANGQVSAVTVGGTPVAPGTDGSIALPVGTMPAGYTFPAGDNWKINFPPPNSSSAVTQFAGQQTVGLQTQDGHSAGSLESFSIGGDGTITGSFSDGTTLALGEIALASFTNPSGLTDAGNGTYQVTPNSGQPSVGTAGTGGRGELLGGELEQSNVNLGTELTNLINAQESYDANTKVLTTSQQVIQSLESAA
ncbi:MAG TPA: flagellar hook-basal body complex protein [Acidimicrobiales bacterium]|nr:flagellar hook-basal body complex protein [Acidimicrobiales bacterium]